MKLHERYFIAAKARNELDKAVTDTISRHGLTYGELLNILGQLVLTWSAYLIKDERQEEGNHGIVLASIKKVQYTWGGHDGTYTVYLRVVPGRSPCYVPVVFDLESCYDAQQTVFRLNGALKKWVPDVLDERAQLPETVTYVYPKPEVQ